MNELSDYFKKLDALGEVAVQLPNRLARETVNFSKQRFRQQNWVDNSTENWKPRKPIRGETKRRSNRAVLVSTGRLRKSIRVVYVGRDMVIIGTDVPYAKAHNYGYRGTVKQSVRAHIRQTRKGGTVRVRKHNRNMRINIPQRRFIGESAVLTARLQRRATAEFTRALR